MNFLEKIILSKQEDISLLKRKFTIKDFNSFDYFYLSCLDFKNNIVNFNHLSLIAEIKKASPSKGIIRQDFDPILLANIYKKKQVSAISVLTEKNFFLGNLNYLSLIKSEIKEIPLLRKDFIIDEYQIFEAKAYGADAILLISEILTNSQISDFTQIAKELGLAVLLEIHSAKQLSKINFKLNDIIGINNRNLKTFSVDLQNSLIIAKELPDNVIIISESGISIETDFKMLMKNRIAGILVGEYFMKQNDIEKALSTFMEMLKK